MEPALTILPGEGDDAWPSRDRRRRSPPWPGASVAEVSNAPLRLIAPNATGPAPI